MLSGLHIIKTDCHILENILRRSISSMSSNVYQVNIWKNLVFMHQVN